MKKTILFILFLIFISGLCFSAEADITTDDIRALKPPAEIKEKLNLWPFFIFLVFLLGVLGGIYYFRRQKKIQEMPPVPPMSPDEMALGALEELINLNLIEQGKIKEYYFRISDIIRTYIEGRYRIFALDRTTWELYSEMRQRRIERIHIDKILDFLEECDLVKFAKYMPTPKETEEIFKKAKEIVEITISKSQISTD